MVFWCWKSCFPTVLLNLCLISRNVLSTSNAFPGAIFTKQNTRLRGHTFKSNIVPSQISCAQACLFNQRCYSTNFKEVPSQDQHEHEAGLCEMNNERSLDLIQLENDLHYEHGCVYSRYPKDGRDDCRWSGCQHNGFCVMKEKDYAVCICQVPWTGTFCEAKIKLYNFTTLGATGRIGPDSNAGYSGTVLQDVQVKDGKQEWQVSISGKVRVEACGASGGEGSSNKKGGLGAKVSGALTLTKGDKLEILVGQRGSTPDGFNPGSGGGGTFVFRPSSGYAPIFVAGGGGGGGTYDGLPGNDQPGGSGNAAGNNGAGGLVCRDTNGNYVPDSGGGAGYLGQGGCLESGKQCGTLPCSKAGESLVQGFKGGGGPSGCDGGFGGGGACGAFPGGGGGYSGGGLAPDMVAGGGGSYSTDHTWSVVKGGCNEGDGYVAFIIED